MARGPKYDDYYEDRPSGAANHVKLDKGPADTERELLRIRETPLARKEPDTRALLLVIAILLLGFAAALWMSLAGK